MTENSLSTELSQSKKKELFVEMYCSGIYTQKQIADQLSISEKTVTRWKRDPKLLEQIVLAERRNALGLLPLANQQLEQILESPESSDNSKIKVAQLVYQSSGLLLKDAVEVTLKEEEKPLDIDALAKALGVDNNIKPAEKVEPAALSEPQSKPATQSIEWDDTSPLL